MYRMSQSKAESQNGGDDMLSTSQEIILACVVGIPVVFALGRYSTRITWFHARTQEKYSVAEFVRGRE
jgi:hypothetical protein